MIQIKKFIVNPLQENTYLLFDETKEAIVVDPGFYYEEEQQEIDDFIEKNKLKLVKIINTHCHFDHIIGVEYIRKKYQVPFCAHHADLFWVQGLVEKGRSFGFNFNPVNDPDCFINETDTINFGNSELMIFHVPGHSPGHLVFYSNSQEFILAGDVLFQGSIGRTDLEQGDFNQLITNIKEKLFPLPDETVVYSGHGADTTIGYEKRNNPFLRY